MRTVTLVDWTDLLFHAEELGFSWNYSHEILRVFQGYDRTIDIYCNEIDEYVPMEDEYIGAYFKNETVNDGDVNQMGRDIVYDFMQKHNLKEMTIASADRRYYDYKFWKKNN